MARSFSSAKVMSSLVARAINGAGRGFSSAAGAPQGAVVSKAAARNGATMGKKTGEEIGRKPTEKVSWVPDPRTGFYRPENVAEEIDVAELRAALLKKH